MLFSVSSYAATMVGSQHPIYFFLMGNETLMCKSYGTYVNCLAKDNDSGIVVKYTCTPVPPSQGYLANCFTKPTINQGESYLFFTT